MKKPVRYALSAFSGAACAALPVSLSRLLIRNLSVLFSRIGELAALDAETLNYGAQILSQLISAVSASPWIAFLPAGAVLGILIAWLFRRHPVAGVVVSLILMLLLLIPLTALALLLTTVNSIHVGLLIRTLIPIAAHLL